MNRIESVGHSIPTRIPNENSKQKSAPNQTTKSPPTKTIAGQQLFRENKLKHFVFQAVIRLQPSGPAPIRWAPEPIVIDGVIIKPYKWPKINGYMGLFHPTYSGEITPLITIVGAHLVGVRI